MWVTQESNREKIEIPGVTVFSSWVKVPDVLFWYKEPQTCGRCHGAGETLRMLADYDTTFDQCYQCYGTGWVAKERNNPKNQKKGSNDARQKDA